MMNWNWPDNKRIALLLSLKWASLRTFRIPFISWMAVI